MTNAETHAAVLTGKSRHCRPSPPSSRMHHKTSVSI